MGSMSNQNCCKGFRFTEKVEKHWFTGTVLMYYGSFPTSVRPRPPLAAAVTSQQKSDIVNRYEFS